MRWILMLFLVWHTEFICTTESKSVDFVKNKRITEIQNRPGFDLRMCEKSLTDGKWIWFILWTEEVKN